MSPAMQQMLADRAKLNAPLTRQEAIASLEAQLQQAQAFGAPNAVISKEAAARIIELLREQVQP